MFGIGLGELVIILLAILVFINPKKFPEIIRKLGKFIGELKNVKDELTFDLDSMYNEENNNNGNIINNSDNKISKENKKW